MRTALVVVCIASAASFALADAKKPAPKPESKAMVAAKAWVAAMVDPKAPLPEVSAEHPQVHDTNSVLKGCDSRGGTITTPEKLAKVKACYVVSYKDMKLKKGAKPTTVEEKPYKDKSIGEDRILSTLKDVPTTSTIVDVEWEKGEKSVHITVLVDPDDRIRVAWMAWQDHGAGD